VNAQSAGVAQRLDAVAEEFGDLAPRERLELLLEFAEKLPPLPAEYQAERERAEHRVHECQTPVFIWVRVAGDRVELLADVASEAPTVKGFVSILVEVFAGGRPAEVLAIEPNLVQRLGLVEALGMQRMRGLQAILFYVRNQIRQALAN
jgi:cysteine desulfuration protein SufE